MSISRPLSRRQRAGTLPLDTLFLLADQGRHSEVIDIILAARCSTDKEFFRFELSVYMEYLVSLDREDVWGHYVIYNLDIDEYEDIFDINEFTACCFYKKCYKPLLEISYRPHAHKTLDLFSRGTNPLPLTGDAIKALIQLGFSGERLLDKFLTKIQNEENVDAFVACVTDLEIERNDVHLVYLDSGKLYDSLFVQKGLVSEEALLSIGESALNLTYTPSLQINPIGEVMFYRNLLCLEVRRQLSQRVQRLMFSPQMSQFIDIQKIVATLLLCLRGKSFWVKRMVVDAVWDSYFNNRTIIYGPISSSIEGSPLAGL